MNPVTIRYLLGNFVRGYWQPLYLYQSEKLTPPIISLSTDDCFAFSLLTCTPRYLLSANNSLTLSEYLLPDVNILVLSIRSLLLQSYRSLILNDITKFSQLVSSASVVLKQLIRKLGYQGSFELVWSESDLVALEHTFRSVFTVHNRLVGSTFPSRISFVLGMHRSGTSALTGMLNTAGLDAPIDPLGATESNPFGYWESERLVASTDQFLSNSCFHWSALFNLPSAWFFTSAAQNWISTYYSAIADVFPNSTHALLKDPRLCIISNAFSPWLQSGLVNVDCILIIRQPLEVAFSLQKSEGISLYQSICLWISSVLESERVSRFLPRVCVTYDQLVDEPAAVIDACRNLFQRDPSFVDHQSLSSAASSFVRPELRRQRMVSLLDEIPLRSPLSDLLSFANIIYGVFEELSEEPLVNQSDRLDSLNDQWQLFSSSLSTVDYQVSIER